MLLLQTIVHTHDAARRRAVQRLLSEKQLNAGEEQQHALLLPSQQEQQ
jgi:hypothetical protein